MQYDLLVAYFVGTSSESDAPLALVFINILDIKTCNLVQNFLLLK